MAHSPFTVVQNFLSPKQCESIINDFEVKTPNFDKDGRPSKLVRSIPPERGQALLTEKIREQIPEIESRYNATYRGTEPFELIHYPENDKQPAEVPGCGNSQYVRRKWVKTKDIDLTGVIWLKDYQDKVPLDPRFEVFGGKMEFPALDFSLVPERGTLLLWPAGPHFITALSPVLIGDLYLIKVNIAISQNGGMFLYQPSNFPVGKEGFIMSWFKEYL